MEQLICQGNIHLCISEISEQADCHTVTMSQPPRLSHAYIRQKLMTKPNLTVKAVSFKQQYEDRSVLYRAGGLLNMQLLSSSFLAFAKSAQYTQHNACALVGPDNFTIYTGRCVYLHLFADIILT